MGYPFHIVMPAEDAAKVAPQQKEIEWDAVHAMLGQAFRGHKIRAPSLCRTCWRKMGRKIMEDFFRIFLVTFALKFVGVGCTKNT